MSEKVPRITAWDRRVLQLHQCLGWSFPPHLEPLSRGDAAKHCETCSSVTLNDPAIDAVRLCDRIQEFLVLRPPFTQMIVAADLPLAVIRKYGAPAT